MACVLSLLSKYTSKTSSVVGRPPLKDDSDIQRQVKLAQTPNRAYRILLF